MAAVEAAAVDAAAVDGEGGGDDGDGWAGLPRDMLELLTRAVRGGGPGA
jgi:hypothetical protein